MLAAMTHPSRMLNFDMKSKALLRQRAIYIYIHSPAARVFCISFVFSNARRVLSQCNTRLRFLHLRYDMEVMWRKKIKHAFSMFYTLIKHGFLTNQSARRVPSIYL